jgi:hypothetical protein
MDETALPILLVDLARRANALALADVLRLWPMVRQAVGYLARNGPVSPQDRWEEASGYSPFTIEAEIAALLAAADLADLNHEASIGTYLREIADVWNASIERRMYVSDTDWCRQFKVEGYYVRIAAETGECLPRFQNARGPARFAGTPATPPGMRVRTRRFEKLRLRGQPGDTQLVEVLVPERPEIAAKAPMTGRWPRATYAVSTQGSIFTLPQESPPTTRRVARPCAGTSCVRPWPTTGSTSCPTETCGWSSSERLQSTSRVLAARARCASSP